LELVAEDALELEQVALLQIVGGIDELVDPRVQSFRLA
jgi:hypothetical protein